MAPINSDRDGAVTGIRTPDTEQTVRLTVAQATVRFLAAQHVERDGERTPFFAGCFGIFGHGNVAGLGQALLQAETEDLDAGREPSLPYVLGRNEQAMVHSAVAYARMKDRLQAWAVTASVGPGSTNMVTGAALATINRLPVLLLPADTFATRASAPVLQELERPDSGDVTVNDCFRPVSRFFDRVWRPEQLPAALLGAMRVLTDPVETGTATVAIPQDVQAEAFDWPVSLFAERTWHVGRPLPERAALARAAEAIRSARRPLIVAGGGVVYSRATDALARFCERTGIPVGQSQAGKGSLPYDHPQSVGAIGSTGTTAANALAAEADLVIGIGTRYSDFTSASRTAFTDPDVRFVNINVASFDAVKQGAVGVVADARETIEALDEALAGYAVSDGYRALVAQLAADWEATVDAVYSPGVHGTNVATGAEALTQNEVIGLVNAISEPRDVVVCAAGSMPGDLHKLWRTRDPKGYHVEYGYSCMGYEVAGGLGVAMACPDRDVFVMVGDGSYLMMATELVTAVQEGVKVIVVLVQNHGFASIGSLSESLGSQRFGTSYRYRSDRGRLDGGVLPVDLAANAASLGVDVLRATTAAEFADALEAAKASDRATVVHVETDPLIGAPDSESWWDVPVSETSTLESTQQAREVYEAWKKVQRPYLRPSEPAPESSSTDN
ncbi:MULTISPECIES: 3D-(3,5/4)-trihydroxycyclohexane-1,2-dione acylhydrolase (decyclizing) [Rhodococcus]|uniref:3D-(3,5/4)-trihydroxycyclohexane-1,2-dione acylhydrolase (decyclizing) n=1 Tax=Rhodococcus TaxID=1827 RepID=UPI00193C2A21|nr:MULTISPECIES: 3D-(3,5/4)-trihydroxycyclohexane-1,2-dione acylhydrolase (decyclizing) [Rhodococcus]QRI76072.1 3D-(3,5/4)-trihydroxycyclohexane-1,2-dione acylhydrolase (decyclizing) [Rhodococcus aetherivorans]QSE59483.1 3D-(3,5/4)-trihydroxycyclohexane-1,2-dione acylhydrolase (decyclizing) [Rhodococcus sp. PSBB066]QSE69192.1 3D-(3,5/4)-trihydroxycyclohexane-1,2-dione acylhydrolase (decyclizing) [Rhodococcus sp. PSBB049]UGQ40551.1 3D-(3,5/4)-trihydroxycyclohexane-1,2-dione acylhydrolase (decycl